MTTNDEHLAAIEALPEGTYRDTKGIGWHGTVVSPSQLEWLIAEVRRLTDENKQLRENYEMAKRIIHSAGGLTRETLP